MGWGSLFLGDCCEVLRSFADNLVDSVVTDPPYGFKFMGKSWDYEIPGRETWKEVYRVLKPGGHLLSFGGPRTYHRLACAVEDAGFEIRDQLQWLFGSGFPKSLDVSKAIDKAAGVKREILSTIKKTPSAAKVHEGWAGPWAEGKTTMDITGAATDAAKLWQGFGTALKPANEPILLARKPLSEKTVAQNVLKWGTGGLNIDGTRIGTDNAQCVKPGGDETTFHGQKEKARLSGSTCGRWPANLILDEVAAEMLDEQTKERLHSAGHAREKKHEINNGAKSSFGIGFKDSARFGDSGGASRFFYIAKASRKERNAGLNNCEAKKTNDGRKKDADNAFQRGKTLRQNHHPTVKPVTLMRYLVRLVTPPNGLVLDPFMGSGTTGMAALYENFRFMGIEKDSAYLEIAQRRIDAVHATLDSQQGLGGL